MTLPNPRKMITAVALVAAVALLAACSHKSDTPSSAVPVGKADVTPASASTEPTIIGSWYVKVGGAAYADHLFVFLHNGVMLSFNPSRVQEKPGGKGVNDSAGVGAWQVDVSRADGVYLGTFRELNAAQGTSKSADPLFVTWRIKITGDKLTGTAMAAVGTDPTLYPATFTGERLTIDTNVLAKVAPLT